MKRISITGITGVAIFATFVLSAVAASPASAGIDCLRIQTVGNGSYNEGCMTTNANGNFIYGEKRVRLAGIEWCAKTRGVREGEFTSQPNCENNTTPVTKSGEWARVLIPEPAFAAALFPTTFTATSGANELETGSTQPIACQSDVATGEVTGEETVGSVMVTFSGCHSTEAGGCTVKGGGAGTGKILSNVLDGELGSVKRSEATSEVGLLLLPTTGTEFTKIEGTCLLSEKTPVDGTVAGEVTPINASSTEGKLIFAGSKGKQEIKAISVLGTTLKPVLKALGLLESSEASVESLTFAEAIEVT
jgi:hypothetical protein